MRRFFFVALAAAACSSPSSQAPEEKPPPHPTRSCTTTIRSSTADAVAGEFTDWDEVALVDGRADFHDLPPGEYAYALLSDGEVLDRIPPNTATKWWDGTEYLALQVVDCQSPTWTVEEAHIEDGVLTARLQFVSANDGTPLDPQSVSLSVGGRDVEPEIDADQGTVSISSPLDGPGKYTLRASAEDTSGRATDSDLWLPLWHDREPWSWQDALLYLVFTDRFRDTDGAGATSPDGVEQIAAYQGGDFAGVEQAIEEGYFEALGVDALWLSPVYDNPEAGYLGSDGVHLYTGYHGYWPTDFLTAEPNLGGDEALHSLIDTAHARGIRIVFDIVLNHVHEDHGYCSESPDWCQTTCVCGTENCAYDGEGGRPLDCQFAPYLPDLDYRNHDIVMRVADDLFALLSKFDVDGLRIDAAKHMDQVILRAIRRRTEELEAQGAAPFWLIGETFTGDRGQIMQYVSDDQLHGQFDFPLFYAVRGTFAHGESFRNLEGAAAASQREYGQHSIWMSPFLGNHDVERFVSAAAGNVRGPFDGTPDLLAEGGPDEITQWDLINRMSMAFAFLLTQPGIPLIYYGDEVGLAGGPDPDNRRMMPATLNANQLELLNRVQQLGQLRRELDVLRHGGRKELWIDDDAYVYVRDGAPGEAAIIGMNKGNEPRTMEVNIPNALGLTGATLRSRNSERVVSVIDGTINLTLDPWEYVILTPE